MSRGGRGGRFGGGAAMPPMGLTFADMASMRTQGSSALYPPQKMKHMNAAAPSELEYANAAGDYYELIRLSPYNLPEEATEEDNSANANANQVERYSDKYKLKPNTVANQDHLSSLKSIMNPEFFPAQVFDGVRMRKTVQRREKRKIDWDDAENAEEDQEEELEEEEEGDDGEDDADYANQYFDNGEGDEDDGGDDDGGGGGGDFE
ncbi:hypothetical protein E3P92_01246 [Wallemia ichthyophaga]|uniref:DNA-directed RNA polymerase III subunit n=2 Tax=Wallemia ichthyophaga TaxID=245174 RepID=A0A4T0GC43_WALIC|nr:uncharacterized protein J056_000592 [Wallemia ichthyophaga EXF-994]TIA74386.1 hypothetical protein E3P91_00953 [Wallemia ichthyophaga]EOR00782.1 hypothetical protein J056_000592 [Wallemia ichthyophaga EXF-994]TIA92826.1 hypothetical protein E3P97_01260 [Wallemia ichthyophaga]TIA98154.1 hypothetical protein E3P95_02566 [Wallemia ichthyophaga]TIB06279.1 hypothetical protein E3P96_00618 [Wallemia ichthyophaga]